MLQVNPKVGQTVMILNTALLPSQCEHQIMKAVCHLSCTGHPRVECGINGKVMQRLEKEARAEQERRIGLEGVTGEVIHEESSLQRGDGNRRQGDVECKGVLKQEV